MAVKFSRLSTGLLELWWELKLTLYFLYISVVDTGLDTSFTVFLFEGNSLL